MDDLPMGFLQVNRQETTKQLTRFVQIRGNNPGIFTPIKREPFDAVFD